MIDLLIVTILPALLIVLVLVLQVRSNKRKRQQQDTVYTKGRENYSAALLRFKIEEMLAAGVSTSNRNYKKAVARLREIEDAHPQ